MAYKITIRSLGESNSDYVQAYVPDEFVMNLEHNWENPFEVSVGAVGQAATEFISEKVTGKKTSAVFDPSVIGDAAGINTFVYRGTSPMQLTIELEFVIKGSIEQDLRTPVKRLISMSCPKKGNTLGKVGTLSPPDMVQVTVPGVLDIKKAFIMNIGVNMMKPLVTDGTNTLPLRARVPVTFSSAYITTKERLDYTLFP